MKTLHRLLATCAIATPSLLAFVALSAPQVEAQSSISQSVCSGALPGGWTFSADAQDGAFLHVIVTGPQGQSRVAMLQYYSRNEDGFPVFTGILNDSVDLVLLDQSDDSSDILVFTEEWGWSPGTCTAITEENPAYDDIAEPIRKSLVGSRDTTATTWLRRNGFSLQRNVSITRNGKIERWSQNPETVVDVEFYRGRISDVTRVLE